MVKKSTPKTPKIKLIGLAFAALAVFGGGILFVGAASGWFNNQPEELAIKIALDDEYLGGFEVRALDIATYNELVENKKSFVLVSYLPGCTAQIVEFASRFGRKQGITIYYMNFSDLKDTALHEKVKYSPSMIIIYKGQILDFLKSDSNEDIEKYNDYEAFSAWLQGKIDFSAKK